MNNLPTNCPNCGAELDKGVCKYCGTKVFEHNTLEMLSNGATDITLRIERGNEVHIIPLTGYISDITFTRNDGFSYRDCNGMIRRVVDSSPNVEFNFVGSVRNDG